MAAGMRRSCRGREPIYLYFYCKSPTESQSKHENHPSRSVEECVRIMNKLARDAWQKPHQVMMPLELERGDSMQISAPAPGILPAGLPSMPGKSSPWTVTISC